MAHQGHHDDDDTEELDMLDPEDAEEVFDGEDDDVAMDSGEEDGEGEFEEAIALQNDSSAHFDGHHDSIFCIAQHPLDPRIVATGGGDDVAYVFDATPEPSPLLPTSYQSEPAILERKSLEASAKLEGHSDSVNAIAFSLPDGKFLATAGLDGKLIAWKDTKGDKSTWKQHATVQEVEEINWLAPCPAIAHPNAFALGASDGSVWVYQVTNSADPLSIVQAYYLHSGSCTAGSWTPDGKILVTISDDGSLNAWDPWGEAAAVGLAHPQGGQALITLTADDERFRAEGGLFSIAISPGGTLAAVGGADGSIQIVGLPRLSAIPAAAGARAVGKAGQKATSSSSMGQAGQILATLDAHAESVETLSFSDPPLTLLAAGSVDSSVVLFDVAHGYAVRRRIESAHDGEAVIQVQFLKGSGRGNNGWALTTCGNDGVVRRWDARGGTAAAAKGLVHEWKGHRGDGEGGGVLGFVMGADGKRIVTAGDE
jgi:ribosome assembly protein SQT1